MYIIKQELSLGFPSLIAQLSSGITMITFNTIILKVAGNTGVAAYGVVANISLVIVAIYTGIAQGIQPLVSGLYGVGDNRQARTILQYALITMLSLSGIIYLSIFAFAELQQISVMGLRSYFISNPFVGYNIILATFFTSIEKALPAHILSVLRGLVLIVPMAFLLSALWKMTGVWLTYPITESIVSLSGYVIYKNKYKEKGTNAHEDQRKKCITCHRHPTGRF